MAGMSITEFMASPVGLAMSAARERKVHGRAMAPLSRVVAASRGPVAASSPQPQPSPAATPAEPFLDGSLLSPAQRRKLQADGNVFSDQVRPALPIMESPAKQPKKTVDFLERADPNNLPTDHSRGFLPGTVAASKGSQRLDGSLLSPAQLKQLRDRGIDVAGRGEL